MADVIYALLDPVSREVRYVGKATDASKRLREHCKDRRKTYKVHWISELKRAGKEPEILILETMPEGDSFAWISSEQFWIANFRMLGAKLTNLTDGGEGTVGARHSKETIEKIRGLKRGKKHSPETRAKMSVAQRKRTTSEETKRKQSAAKKGIAIGSPSADTRRKLSIAGTAAWQKRKIISLGIRKQDTLIAA